MTAIEKIQEALSLANRRIQSLAKEREAIDEQMRAARAEVSELELALRIIGRYSETGDSGVLPQAPSNQPLTKRDAVLTALDRNPGAMLSNLIEWIDQNYQMRLNSKTAGNLLWHLKNEGLARREGKRWFAATKTPPDESGGVA